MRNTCLIAVLLFSFRLSDAQSDSLSADTLIQGASSKEEIYNRALVYYKASQYSGAILSADSCLIIDSAFTDALFIKALSLEKSGNPEKATKLFEKIKLIAPRYSSKVDRRIKNYYFTVYLSKNWYYMLAMLLLTVLIFAVVAKSVTYKRM